MYLVDIASEGIGNKCLLHDLYSKPSECIRQEYSQAIIYWRSIVTQLQVKAQLETVSLY